MRPILHGDVSSAARALLVLPPQARDAVCRQMIRQAQQADHHVRENGRVHPIWGNGSLMAAARNWPLADEPGFDDVDYCHCFKLVLRALIDHHCGTGNGRNR
ncbi:DUF7742 family protein [Pontibaca salina]|uniref:DUF7742 domain-containing protein n=1 Tax=Pontibaca salina TaxID=2795731 RepID=A0A934HLK0_9RHOB|nr:hypothetical protein [Pontibaca salina]MBI6630439.1 hypothetical protein [Pontibaca salina]